MAILLGIDTGGTFTDAVLLDDSIDDAASSVVASAKALTTRHDLSIGIGNAIAEVCDLRPDLAGEIALVSLSTTLATNAVVEAQGGRVGLVLIELRPERVRHLWITRGRRPTGIARSEPGQQLGHRQRHHVADRRPRRDPERQLRPRRTRWRHGL